MNPIAVIDAEIASLPTMAAMMGTSCECDPTEAIRRLTEARSAILDLVESQKACLHAMDIARDSIQPITMAQLKLHNLDPATADKLDAAAAKAIAALAPFKDESQ